MKGRFPVLYGAIVLVVGLLLIATGTRLEQGSDSANPAASAHRRTPTEEMFYKLIDEFGIALVILGALGVLIETRDWKEYFQDRVAEIIVRQSYLEKLGPEELISLQTNTLKAFFKNNEIDRKDSFLEYFHSKIHSYIGSPYRENVRSVMKVKRHASDTSLFSIEEGYSYTCRRVGTSIQDAVRWSDSGESHTTLQEFRIEVGVPEPVYKSPGFSKQHPNVKEMVSKFDLQSKKLIAQETGTGYTLPLTDFDGIDGLTVKVHAVYSVPSSEPMTWIMSHPTRGLTGTLAYPEDMRLITNVFGVADDDIARDKQKGLLQISYDSWLLPNSGFAFDLVEAAPVMAEIVPSAHVGPAGTGPGEFAGNGPKSATTAASVGETRLGTKSQGDPKRPA